MNISKYFGPSTLIAAAFIGPGTVTVCTMAGVKYGYNLLFALVFAIICTLTLQEVAARVGLLTQKGLGTQVRRTKSKGIYGFIFFYLVVFSILIGNAAYEAGNIGGALLGIEVFTSTSPFMSVLVASLAFFILYFGNFKWIQNTLIALVLLIFLAFVMVLFVVRVDISEVLSGLIPKLQPNTDWSLIIALVGTTVVPYNLFLHASTIQKKYKGPGDLADVRIENAVAVVLGGLVSMLILVVAATTRGAVYEISSAADLAYQLKPVLGDAAGFAIGVGLFAAGLSSAITAPYAAAFAARELFELKSKQSFNIIWAGVLGIGLLFSLVGFTPIWLITFAQITNGILLPILAFYLLYLANSREHLGKEINSFTQNLILGSVCLIALVLAGKVFWSLLNSFL